MNCLILNLGCKCKTIVISFKSGSLQGAWRVRKMAGAYQKARHINFKPSWISTNKKFSIWYNKENWWVGFRERRGYLGDFFKKGIITGFFTVQGVINIPTRRKSSISLLS